MTQSLWPGHPLFGAPTTGEATDRLDLLDDGILCLAPGGTIISANAEACRILDLTADIVGQRADALLPDVAQWRDLLEGGDGQHRRDVVFRARGGPQIMATARQRVGQSAPEIITLRDVETIRHRRERAGGVSADSNVRFLSANRTRPDFATQRRLCPDLNRMLSRGERGYDGKVCAF